MDFIETSTSVSSVWEIINSVLGTAGVVLAALLSWWIRTVHKASKDTKYDVDTLKKHPVRTEDSPEVLLPKVKDDFNLFRQASTASIEQLNNELTALREAQKKQKTEYDMLKTEIAHLQRRFNAFLEYNGLVVEIHPAKEELVKVPEKLIVAPLKAKPGVPVDKEKANG